MVRPVSFWKIGLAVSRIQNPSVTVLWGKFLFMKEKWQDGVKLMVS
jgi:hypothetical protein